MEFPRQAQMVGIFTNRWMMCVLLRTFCIFPFVVFSDICYPDRGSHLPCSSPPGCWLLAAAAAPPHFVPSCRWIKATARRRAWGKFPLTSLMKRRSRHPGQRRWRLYAPGAVLLAGRKLVDACAPKAALLLFLKNKRPTYDFLYNTLITPSH